MRERDSKREREGEREREREIWVLHIWMDVHVCVGIYVHDIT